MKTTTTSCLTARSNSTECKEYSFPSFKLHFLQDVFSGEVKAKNSC